MASKPISTNMETNFKLVFSKYYAPLCLYARRYIVDADACKNIVSDVFLTLWEKKGELDFQSPTILAYIKLSVRNNCIDYIRHKQHELKHEEYCLAQEELISDMSPDTIYSLDELYEILYSTLDKLPAIYKSVFIKGFQEGLTQSEIASQLGISDKSVFRYRKKVLDELSIRFRDYMPILLLLIMYRYDN